MLEMCGLPICSNLDKNVKKYIFFKLGDNYPTELEPIQGSILEINLVLRPYLMNDGILAP